MRTIVNIILIIMASCVSPSQLAIHGHPITSPSLQPVISPSQLAISGHPSTSSPLKTVISPSQSAISEHPPQYVVPFQTALSDYQTGHVIAGQQRESTVHPYRASVSKAATSIRTNTQKPPLKVIDKDSGYQTRLEFNSAVFEFVKSALLGLSVGFARTVGAAKLEVTDFKQGKDASNVGTDFHMWFNITPETSAFKLS